MPETFSIKTNNINFPHIRHKIWLELFMLAKVLDIHITGNIQEKTHTHTHTSVECAVVNMSQTNVFG